MDPRHLGATPGSDGSGGQSVDASARRRRRMSAPLTGTRLMLAFNAAAGDGYGGRSSSSSSSSSGGLDLSLDEPHPRYSHHRVYPEFSPMSNMGRLLFHGSPLGSPTADDDVLVMDGVLVADGFSPGPRRYASFTDLGLVHTNSPGSGGSGRHGSSLQVIDSHLLSACVWESSSCCFCDIVGCLWLSYGFMVAFSLWSGRLRGVNRNKHHWMNSESEVKS